MKKSVVFSATVALLTFASGVIQAEDEWDDWGEAETEETPLIPISGFIESTASFRTHSTDAIDEDWVAQDLRARIQTFIQQNSFQLSYKGELFYDGITSEAHAVNREAYIGFTPISSIDVKAGRQVLTWGTGDLLFLNDFFPKNWVAFFSGYDQQYLKAPSDALKVSGFNDIVNIDLVISPEFDPDIFVNGEKLVYFSPFAQSIVSAPPKLKALNPGSNLSDGELALRFYKTVSGVEYAGYYYRGFFKTPEGYDTNELMPYFPKLQALGASARASAMGGIANLEYAYWDSRESRSGENPNVPTNQSRFLMGYETEVIRNLTASFQYYAELTHNYDTLKQWYPDPDTRPRRVRQVLTTRWTLSTSQTNLIYSAFLFYSPSDRDYYLIPNVMYRMGDKWQFNAGANLLGGQKDHTLFGQMELNSNIYVRAKYIF